MEDTKKMLEEAIENEFLELSNLPTGSQEKSEAIEALAKLYRLKIEENGCIADKKTEHGKLSEQKKDRYFKLGIAAAELIVPLIFYGVWMKKGFQFEETGSLTSSTFRGLWNHFRPTKI